MEVLISLIIMLILIDIAAVRWGVNSIDGPDSPEWERRRNWNGFH